MLLNGRRLAPHPLNQTVDQAPSVLVNANVIPAGLIERALQDLLDRLRHRLGINGGLEARAGADRTTRFISYHSLEEPDPAGGRSVSVAQ